MSTGIIFFPFNYYFFNTKFFCFCLFVRFSRIGITFDLNKFFPSKMNLPGKNIFSLSYDNQRNVSENVFEIFFSQIYIYKLHQFNNLYFVSPSFTLFNLYHICHILLQAFLMNFQMNSFCSLTNLIHVLTKHLHYSHATVSQQKTK